jgi:hypothetical protein
MKHLRKQERMSERSIEFGTNSDDRNMKRDMYKDMAEFKEGLPT